MALAPGDAQVATAGADVEAALQPFPASALGWFCLGYNLSDAPGRVRTIMDLLSRSAAAPRQCITQPEVSKVLDRLQRYHPQWITLHASSWASCVPINKPALPPWALAVSCVEWAGYTGSKHCSCGAVLHRWRDVPASFMTLSRGMVQGKVVFLRCFPCHAVYGGRWCWTRVPEDSTFPSGFHQPHLKGDATHPTRWFFVTPQVCWEKDLLTFLLGCVARGGMSLTATFEVYHRLWGFTLRGTQYAQRTHFLSKLEVALMVWASTLIIEESPADAKEFLWMLRPHHIAKDFEPLVAFLRRAFHLLSATHRCPLRSRVPGVVVDGKWCIQTLICNARDGGLVWDASLATGFLTGCTERPVPGGKYCARHMQECTVPVEECTITEHREVRTVDSILLEYKVDDEWRPASQVDTPLIRAYELTLLRARTVPHTDESSTCNKDTRKGVAETFASRKSSGVLAAVMPCLQIAAVRPMYSSESVTQVLVFIAFVLEFFTDLRFVIYDNACGMVRSLKKKCKTHAASPLLASAWGVLAALQWVIDRLHWTYHRGCRDQSSGWYVPGVDPASHPVLIGVDTEAAEQVFHIANRWQTVLSNTNPIHQELFLLIFAWQHNTHHSCDAAVQKYLAAQKAGPTRVAGTSNEPPPVPHQTACAATGRRAKKQKLVCPPTACACSASSSDAKGAADIVAQPSSASSATSVPASESLPRVSWAVLNPISKTVHSVVLPKDVYSCCSWSFQGRANVVALETLRGRGFSLCGVCHGERSIF